MSEVLVLTVHALRHGFSICGFPEEREQSTDLLPINWPKGHRWVYTYAREKITCPGCRQALGLPLTEEPVRAIEGAGAQRSEAARCWWRTPHCLKRSRSR
jgi:hypothetical protein